MTPGTRRALTVLAAVALLVMGFQVADHTKTALQVEAAAAELAAGQTALDDQLGDGAARSERLDALRETSARYDRLLDARGDFLTSVAAAASALESAKGKVDTADERAKILALQTDVLAERVDVRVVTDATAAVDAEASAVEAAVADYDREQARRAAQRAAAAASVSRAWSGGGGAAAASGPVAGGYDRVRAALDRVGGGHVPLQEFAGACGGVTSAACASPGVIRFTPGLATWSDGRLHWAMAHELAHIHQFNVWGTLLGSAGFSSLFGGNIELLANCMAAQRGYGSVNVSCSGAQLQYAGAIWGGFVPA